MKGYIALTTVLVLIPLLLLTGVSSMYDNITNMLVSKMNYDSQILRTNSETCLEETVYKIKRNWNFTGEYTITQDTWNCTVTISDKSGVSGVKVLNIIAKDTSNSQITLKRELDLNVNPFELTNIE